MTYMDVYTSVLQEDKTDGYVEDGTTGDDEFRFSSCVNFYAIMKTSCQTFEIVAFFQEKYQEIDNL